jgi:N-acetylglucosamine repressor
MSSRGERVANHELLKQVNAALVYRLIDTQGPISRVDIAQISALAPASVTNITRQLLENSLIKEVAQQASTGGRPAISLTTEQTAFLFISCRLGREELQCSVMDLSGVIHQHTVTPLVQHDAEGIVSALQHAIKQHLQTAKAKQQFIAIAITMAGLVDPQTGTVLYSPNHQIANLELAQRLQNITQLPIYIGNDTRALALAEYYLGAAKGCQDFILVSIHHGAGSGIISNGQLLLGKNRNVGEIGHIQIDPFGEQCHCGNFGCLETLVANKAIIAQTSALLAKGHKSTLQGEALSIEKICQAAIQNDQVAVQIIRQAGENLGRVIAILVNLFNPEKILVAGEIVQSALVLFPALQQQIQRQSLPNFHHELHLDKAHFQGQGTMGGYALIKRALHESDLLQRIMQP